MDVLQVKNDGFADKVLACFRCLNERNLQPVIARSAPKGSKHVAVVRTVPLPVLASLNTGMMRLCIQSMQPCRRNRLCSRLRQHMPQQPTRRRMLLAACKA